MDDVTGMGQRVLAFPLNAAALLHLRAALVAVDSPTTAVIGITVDLDAIRVTYLEALDLSGDNPGDDAP